MTTTRRTLLGVAASAAALRMAGVAAARADTPLVVFAAASLTEALTRVAGLWAKQGHAMPRLSFASSAVLAKQIDQGAPADLFISADETWMNWLARRGKLRADTRFDVLGNDLVLVEPARSMKPVTVAKGLDLAALLGPGGRLAVGDPASVPAGIYAKQALTSLGLWSGVSDRLAPAENVRAALLLVERGEAPAGVVYGSDVTVAPGVAVAGVFPESSHPPILYPAAALTDAPGVADLLGFLRTAPAMAVFRASGFRAPAG